MRNKHSLVAVLATLLAVGLGGITAASYASGGGGNDHKTSICHRTASDSNPYVFETVDNASLPAHLNNLPGHPAKTWKSDGTWRGVAHVAGDPKNDYIATDASSCQDTAPPPTTPPSTTEVTPVAPVLTAADCDTDGSLTIPEQPEGVAVDPEPGTYGPGTYDVTYVADEGFVLTSDPSGTITVDAASGDCPTDTPTPDPTPDPSPNPHPHNPGSPHQPPLRLGSPPVTIDAGL